MYKQLYRKRQFFDPENVLYQSHYEGKTENYDLHVKHKKLTFGAVLRGYLKHCGDKKLSKNEVNARVF